MFIEDNIEFYLDCFKRHNPDIEEQIDKYYQYIKDKNNEEFKL